MKKLLYLILITSLSVAASAQTTSFLVYSFKGNVSVIDNNVETKAKIGNALTNKSSIKVAANSVVTLICNEAAMFTIKKAGTYQLSKFGDSCKVSSNSVSANYVKYVWAQLTTHEGTPGSNRKAFMTTVGAVSRGGVNNIWVDPKLDTVNYSNGDFPLSWKSYADAKDFEFFLYSASNIAEPFYSTTISKMKISIPSFVARIKPGESYYWISAIKGEENEERKVFNYVTKEKFEAVLAKIKSQKAQFEAPAEEAYRIGFMLEDAHYLSEALQYYTKAATLDATNTLYRSTLMSFKKDYEIK
jgi:hypothetical protein